MFNGSKRKVTNNSIPVSQAQIKSLLEKAYEFRFSFENCFESFTNLIAEIKVLPVDTIKVVLADGYSFYIPSLMAEAKILADKMIEVDALSSYSSLADLWQAQADFMVGDDGVTDNEKTPADESDCEGISW